MGKSLLISPISRGYLWVNIYIYIYNPQEGAPGEIQLVGGFNPFGKYLSKWESSPSRDENKKIFETTT